MPLALSTWVLFILFMQSVNGAQFLNIAFLFVLLAAAPSAAVLLTVIFPLTSIYASPLLSRKLYLSTDVLKLILSSNRVSMLLALSAWVLFILFMQSVNGAQFLNIAFLFVLLAALPLAAVLLTVIFPLASIYASLLSLNYTLALIF